MSASDLENDSSRCRHRHHTCEKPLTPLRIWQHAAGEWAGAVNMLGSKHSCGRLLIGELATRGSKHMRQLRSDSCCAAGGAGEQGLSRVPPLLYRRRRALGGFTQGKRRRRQCLRDAIMGRSCHHRSKFKEFVVKCLFSRQQFNEISSPVTRYKERC